VEFLYIIIVLLVGTGNIIVLVVGI